MQPRSKVKSWSSSPGFFWRCSTLSARKSLSGRRWETLDMGSLKVSHVDAVYQLFTIVEACSTQIAGIIDSKNLQGALLDWERSSLQQANNDRFCKEFLYLGRGAPCKRPIMTCFARSSSPVTSKKYYWSSLLMSPLLLESSMGAPKWELPDLQGAHLD